MIAIQQITRQEARAIVRDNPKVYRAAFVEAPGAPLLDHPQARVTLHERVGGAYDQLKQAKDGLVKQGYSVTFGSLGKNLLRMERDGETRLIGIDKPRSKRG